MMRGKRPLDGLDRDIRDHIEHETQDNIARGMAPEEARRQAKLTFGNVALAKEDTRAVWVPPRLDEMRQDVRYAIRMLRKNPGFAAVVVLTLALGIGANTAIFSLFEAIMLRTLPVQAADGLHFVAHGSAGRTSPGSNYPYFERIAARTDVFAGVTTYIRSTFKVSEAGNSEIAPGQFVSGNYHAVLGVPMILGRGFASEDDRGGDRGLIAVISDGYWTRKFGREPHVLGRQLLIDGRSVSIVGVTAPEFAGLDPGTAVDITLPLAVRALQAPTFLTDHDTWLGVMPIVVRLKAGVPGTQAASVVDTVFQQYLSEPENRSLRTIPGWNQVRASLLPANRGTAGLRNQYSSALQVLLAMVAVVLLIGCANVASLLVARGMARAKEVAVRISIGAGRVRLIRQFLTESLLLAFIGGALGLVLARVGVLAIARMVSVGPNPVVLDLEPNATVMAFTIAVSVLTGILFGLAPALGCTHVDMRALKSAGTAVRGPAAGWSNRQVLVAAQIGLCVLLVSGAGLLVRTLRNLEMRDAGFNRYNLLLFTLDARATSFPAEQLPTLCDELIDRLKGRAGVLSGSCSRNIPVNSRGNATPLEIPGAPPQPLDARFVFTNMVTSEYFRTLGIGVVNGRVFDARDSAKAERVAIVNRAVVREFFGDENPIGRRVHFYKDEANPMTIVGVVEDAAQRSLREEPPRTIYTPLAQLREPESVVTVAVRTGQQSLSLASSVRAEVRALSPIIVVDYIRTMEQQIGATLVRERLLALVSSGFGVLALVLSCIGLYGVVSFDVNRGARDLGIRVALGAQRLDVLKQVLRRALSVSSIGILIGVVGALAATRLLSTLLFGITSRDPVTLGSASALLLLTTLVASYLPARRASRVDPVVVLRTE